MDWRAIDRVARRQHGLVTTRQLLAHGGSEEAITSGVGTGRLERVRRGVFRVAGAPRTQDQAWLAAVLQAGSDVVLSHATAAAAWGLRGFGVPDGIDLLSPSWRPRLPGVRGHLTQSLPPADRTRLRALPVTSVARTLIDASGGLNQWVLGRVVDDALRRKLVTLPRLMRCFRAVPLSGRRPSRAMRQVLAERAPGFHPGGSAQELDVLRILRRAGIQPLPVQQYRVNVEGRTYFLDYAWPETRHALEFDGAGGHDMVSDRHRDRERWRRLRRADWNVWPVTEQTSTAEIVAIGVAATSLPVSSPTPARGS